MLFPSAPKPMPRYEVPSASSSTISPPAEPVNGVLVAGAEGEGSLEAVPVATLLRPGRAARLASAGLRAAIASDTRFKGKGESNGEDLVDLTLAQSVRGQRCDQVLW